MGQVLFSVSRRTSNLGKANSQLDIVGFEFDEPIAKRPNRLVEFLLG
jgi:hypothetical protein